MRKRIYICDGCLKQIDDPHDAEMREFNISYSYKDGMVHPFNFSRKRKIHLCKNCFEILGKLHEEKKEV